MSIYNLRESGRTVARLGKFHKGEKVPTDKGGTRPANRPYFVIKYASGYEHLAESLPADGDVFKVGMVKVLPNHPDPIEQWFPHSLQAWASGENGSLLKVDCNGQTINRFWDSEKKAHDSAPRPCQMGKDGKCPLECKPSGRFRIWLVDYLDTTGLGYFDVETHSPFDIGQIVSALKNVPNIATAHFTMRRFERTINYVNPKNGKRETMKDFALELLAVDKNGGDMFGRKYGEPRPPMSSYSPTPADYDEGEADTTTDNRLAQMRADIIQWVVSEAQKRGISNASAENVALSLGYLNLDELWDKWRVGQAQRNTTTLLKDYLQANEPPRL